MASIVFSDSYYISYVGSISANVRLTFDESYTASTNKSVVTLSKIEVQAVGNTTNFGSCALYGSIKLAGTTVAAIDNTQGGKMASVSLSGSGYCQADISNLTITPVTVEHNANGTKDVTVQLVDGYTQGESFFCARYQGGLTQCPYGVRAPVSGTMSLTSHTRQWTVSYDANGGSGAPAAQTKTYNQALTLSGTKPSKASSGLEGYWTTFNANGGTCSTSQLRSARTQVFTFSKWNTAANGSGTNYNSGGSYTANAAATLYAQYSSSITVAPITLPTPTRSGYGFTGWYTAASGGTKIGNAGASYTPSTDATVYAQWTAQASTIASCSSSVATTNNLALTVSRTSTAFYHKATFKIGSSTLATSSAFATSLSYPVPRGWFNAYPNDTSKTVTVSVQTYTDSGCTTAVGSPATTTFTVTADAGMKPSVSSGWATASAYNTGTAAANISGFVKGYSKAQITFNANKITMANNATIVSYSVTCLGSTDSSSPYLTPVLNATSVDVVCTVTDSRGRTAVQTLTVSVMDYAPPKLSGISVYRCTSNGTASEDGTYYSVAATVTVSSLNNQNTGTLTGALAAAGGSYGTAYSLTSGTRAIKGTISADTSYSVKITATDRLGNTAAYYASVPTRKWAMKFRPDGSGVAFGKAAEYDNAFEVTPAWYIRHGANNGYVPTVRTGFLGSGDYYDITGALAFIVLSYSSSHFAIYNCLGDSITRLAGTATSSVVKQSSGYRVTNTATIGTLRYFILTVL